MTSRSAFWAGLVLALQASCALAGGKLLPLRKQESSRDLPLEQMTDRQRQLAQHVLDKPAFTAQGPRESFFCNPGHYQFFLDHPDKTVTAWRKLGAKCVTITSKADQQFVWADDQGSEVVWETVHRGPELHIWYAEGKVKPGPVMPLVPVKALVVVRHKELRNADGNSLVQQQSDLFVQTDSKTAALVTRMLGPAAHRMAEQGLGQLQLFFSGLSRYLDRYPEQADQLIDAD